MFINCRIIVWSGNLFGIFCCWVLVVFFCYIFIYKNKVINNMNKDELIDFYINDILVG